MKKSSSIILLIILLANSIHAMDNSARNAISNYKAILETEVDKSFGPIVDFSKYQIQTNLVIERKFMYQFLTPLEFGSATRLGIKKNLNDRNEISDFWGTQIIQSIQATYTVNSKNDIPFILCLDTGVGLGLTKLKAINIRDIEIDRWYTDFLFRTEFSVTRSFFKNNNFDAKWKAGIPLTIQFEESNRNFFLGLNCGASIHILPGTGK